MFDTERRFVSLGIEIFIDVPKGLDPESQEGQDYLREEFIDYLKEAKYIALGFEVGELDHEEEEDNED
jgi:hypothetical protein